MATNVPEGVPHGLQDKDRLLSLPESSQGLLETGQVIAPTWPQQPLWAVGQSLTDLSKDGCPTQAVRNLLTGEGVAEQ